ncbi:MAG: FAD-dependent oxidoreductase [Dehalococcoidia bacterium]
MDADVIVVGGGPTGVAAARAASKEGARVALLERYGFLGGSLTSSLVGTLGGLYLKKGDSIDYLVGGIAQDCAETLKSRGLALGPIPWEETAVLPHAPYGLKNLFDEWVGKAENLKLLLHTQLCGCRLNGCKISDISLVNKAGTGKLCGKVFIDASGDGDLAYQAGAEMEGSPVQFPSMNFYMGNVNVAEAFAAGFSALQRLIEDAIDSGDYDLPRCGGAFIPTMQPGQVIVAMGRISIDGQPVNCADPEELTYAEAEGRRQALLLAEFLKAKVPGFSEAFIVDTPTQVGVRSTRRLVGQYVLSRDDVLKGAHFDDAICRCAWPIELHAEGKSTVLEFLEPGEYYEIPYRCLLPREVANMIVAGRCLSASYEAQASARVSGPCMAMGEAAGIAAVLALKKDGNVAEVDISELQSILKQRGAII